MKLGDSVHYFRPEHADDETVHGACNTALVFDVTVDDLASVQVWTRGGDQFGRHAVKQALPSDGDHGHSVHGRDECPWGRGAAEPACWSGRGRPGAGPLYASPARRWTFSGYGVARRHEHYFNA